MSKKFFLPKVLGLTVAIGFAFNGTSGAELEKINCKEALENCIKWKECDKLIVKRSIVGFPVEEFSLGRAVCLQEQRPEGHVKEPCKHGCMKIQQHSLCSVPCSG